MKKTLLTFAALSFFSACNFEVSIKQEVQEAFERTAFREVLYSTYVDGLENVGTINRTYYREHIQPQGEVVNYQRTFMNDGSSKGFLRKTNAIEFAFWSNLKATFKGAEMLSLQGFENFDEEVMGKVSLQSYYDKRMKDPAFKVLQKPRFERWWALTHQVEGTWNQKTMLKGDSLPKLLIPGIQIDSLYIGTISKVENEDCLEYSLFYKDTEPLNLMIFEQHKMAVGKDKKEWKDYQFQGATSQVKHSIFARPSDGRLCREREYRDQENTVIHRESGAVKKFKSQRMVEILYDYSQPETPSDS